MNFMIKKLLLVFILVPFMQMAQAQEEIVKWTFPNNLLTDTVQNSSNPLNAGQVIRVEGAGPISMKNGATDYAVQAINWNDGMNAKNWNIRFLTTGYDHIKLSSKQQGGGNNGGPKDFKLQYKISGAGTWADVPGGTITVANDWTTSAILNLDLPAECQNQSELVYIRWIMATNNDIKGGLVTAAGVSKIDDIIITGMPITGLPDRASAAGLYTFPNPSSSSFTVNMPEGTTELAIYNANGQLVFKTVPGSEIFNVEKKLPAGLYFVKAVQKDKVNLIKHIVK
jgi:hypothetical protein